MERINEFPDTEKELLEVNLCGCGTVRELIDQAAKIVKKLTQSNQCVVWDLCLVDMVHQLYTNQLLLHMVREEGRTIGEMKAHAMHEALTNDIEKIMHVAEEHIKNTVIDICNHDHVPSESDGHAKH